MIKICSICHKQFETKTHNKQICNGPHYIKCRICDELVSLDGPENKKKRQFYFKNNFVYCSHLCSCKGIGLDKWNKENQQVDLERLRYLRTQTSMFDTDIAKELNTTIDFVRSRCERYGWARPNELKNELIQNRNENVSKIMKEKYEDECTKIALLEKQKQTYYKKTGYEHNFKNPNAIKQYKKTKQERYGNTTYTNPTKMIQTRKLKNGGIFWTKAQLEQAKQTKLEKYNHIYSDYIYNNMSKESKEIITNKDKLLDYILNIPFEERTFTNIARQLEVAYSTITRKCREYDIDKTIINVSISQEEKDLVEYLKSLYNGTIIENSKKVIPPYELDIYIPDKNLAIEYNGAYYHTQDKVGKTYHYNKSKLCEEKGIRLIHIFDYEWNNDRQRPILENIIKNALGINEHKIYARNLNILVEPSKNLKSFFQENNIQGFRAGSFGICLVDKNTKEIYMSYMMGHPFYGKGKYEWEVIRGATKLGYTVVGGASKIWKYFIENYKPSSCVYYVDYNYFNGNSLKQLPNMKYIKTQPSFKNYFIKDKIIKNRNPMKNNEIKELYETGECIPIYNAGTKVYVWERNT